MISSISLLRQIADVVQAHLLDAFSSGSPGLYEDEYLRQIKIGTMRETYY